MTWLVSGKDDSQPGQLVLNFSPVTTLIPQKSHEYRMRERKLSLLCGSVTASGTMGWDEDPAKAGLVQDSLPTGFMTEL